MSNPPTTICSTQTTTPSLVTRSIRLAIRCLIVCFVCWHLLAILIRNPLDLWSDDIESWLQSEESGWQHWQPIYDRLAKQTRDYNRLVGCEQGWGMFTSPLARESPYLALEMTFADGHQESLPTLSPFDPKQFFRAGGTRFRKLETSLYRRSAEKIVETEDLPVYAAFVRLSIRRWRQENPLKPNPILIKLYKKHWVFPGPKEPPDQISPGEIDLLGTFDLEGQHQP